MNQNNVSEYLQRKNHLKRKMDQLKNEIASLMGYDSIIIPKNGKEMTSREIGSVGDAIVKELIAQGEDILLEKYGKK